MCKYLEENFPNINNKDIFPNEFSSPLTQNLLIEAFFAPLKRKYFEF